MPQNPGNTSCNALMTSPPNGSLQNGKGIHLRRKGVTWPSSETSASPPALIVSRALTAPFLALQQSWPISTQNRWSYCSSPRESTIVCFIYSCACGVFILLQLDQDVLLLLTRLVSFSCRQGYLTLAFKLRAAHSSMLLLTLAHHRHRHQETRHAQIAFNISGDGVLGMGVESMWEENRVMT